MKLIISIFLIFILLIVVCYISGYYFYNVALNPKAKKVSVFDKDEKSKEEKALKEKQIQWVNDNFKDIYIVSNNNGKLKLHAYEINTNSDIWAIVIHGYMGKGTSMAEYAQKFYERGYNVLLVDLRGHGKSEGNYVGMGWHDRLDIIDWINYIIDKNKKSKIILFGISMGAATTMMTTGENLPSNVKIAISDCGYSSVWDEFKYRLKRQYNLPEFPILYIASNICKRKAKYTLKEASCINQVKKSKIPTLFIHGSADDFVPYKMLDIIYNSAKCEKQKLVIEGAKHATSSAIDSNLYWRTIDTFIEKFLDI